MRTSFYIAATYFGAIILTSSGADTKITLKHIAVKRVTIKIQMLYHL